MIRRKKTLPPVTSLGHSDGNSRLKVPKPKKPFTGNQPGRMTMLPDEEVQEELKSAASRDSEKTTKDIRKRASKPISG